MNEDEQESTGALLRVQGFVPGARLAGPVRLPPSKSLAQRMLLAAGLCGGRTVLRDLGRADDTRGLLLALEQLGVETEILGGGRLALRGRSPGPERGLQAARGAHGAVESISAGESGTAARLLTAAVALCGRPGTSLVLGAKGSLRTRRSSALFECLRAAGASLQGEDGADGWPVRIGPIGPPSSLELRHPASSQELSALLLACAAWPGEFAITCVGPLPSAPYVAMTRSVLRAFGVQAEQHPGSALDGDPDRAAGSVLWLVGGPLRAPALELQVEPDASAAAVALAAACLSGGELSVPGLTPASPQGDVRIAECLRAFGCDARLSTAGLFARGAPLRGADLDLTGEPDLAPVLASVAAAAALSHGASSQLTGLGTLPGKESSRIEVLAGGLRQIGLAASAGPDRLSIGPGPPGSARPSAIQLDPHGDHRMAFAFSLLGLILPGVGVRSPGCVTKSWPGFWDDLRAAGLECMH